MKSYLIQKNDEALQTVEESTFESMQLHYVGNGVDTLSLTIKNKKLSSIVPAFAYGDTIRLFYRDTEATPTDTCVFVGTVEILPTQSDPKTTSGTYTAKGPTFDLQRCDFSQLWYYKDSEGVTQQGYNPNVCLCDNNGVRLKTGEQMAEAVSYAVTRGVNITSGTIAQGLYAPYDQKSNIMCWDVIVAMLRYTPDYTVWWDYNNQVEGAYVPAMNVTASGSMPATSLAHTTLNKIQVTPRNDQVVPGLQVFFEWTSTVDGTTYRSNSVQTAGNYNHARRLSLVYPLDGFHIVTQKQPIEVEAYPYWTDLGNTVKSWAHANVFWLRKLIYTDWNVQTVTRSGSKALPRRLTKGMIVEWMKDDVESEEEDITFKIKFKKKNASGTVIREETKEVTVKVLSTDATQKTYTRQQSFTSAEEEPTDFASDLYTSWSVLHYAGVIGYKMKVPEADLRPGQRINVSGARAEWATMNAVVQDTTINWPSGQINHNVGPCPRYEADTLMAIFRSVRARRFSFERLTRDDPEYTDDIWGASSGPASSISDGAPSDKLERLTVESSDGKKIIDLIPADITNETALTMKPRQVMIVEEDGTGGLQASPCMALCTAVEGDPILIETADIDVLTSVDQFRVNGSHLEIVFGTKNIITGEAGDPITKTIALTEQDVVIENGYASLAFNRTKRTIRVLSADEAGSAEDYVTLVSHASQHPS